MKFLIEVLVDDDQMMAPHIHRGHIIDALDFAVRGAMMQFKDGVVERFAQPIDCEVSVTISDGGKYDYS